jgi:hypothetical protein
MASAHEPAEVTWIEVPGGRLAVEVNSTGYLAHDLFGPLVRLSTEALMADAADIFFGPSKWQQLQVPVRFLTAEWGTGAGSAPAYPAEAVRAFRDALDVLVTVRPVPGVDHAASIISMTGARATADLIAEALS